MSGTADKSEVTDMIEKKLEVKAKRSRVWRAISDAAEFGAWFRVEFDGEFTPGATVVGRLAIPGYEHTKLEMFIQKIEPEEYFSYRWHPYAVDPEMDLKSEPTTLVEFRLEESPGGGTIVTITESGFDKLPSSRRAEAFRMNRSGWDGQSRNLAAYVS